MKGYKGFSKGLVCRGKQCAENTVFEEDDAKICKSGMHFCENPFDVLDYYGFVDDNGELNEYAEVEALDDAYTDDQKIFCTKKLKVGAKLGIAGLVNAFVDFTLNKIKKDSTATDTGESSAATNTGSYSVATNTGNKSAATNTGSYSVATNTGSYSVATNTGDKSVATNTGYCSAATNTGIYSAAMNTGDFSAAMSTGDFSAAMNTGSYSIATNTGYKSIATNTGDCSVATNTGDCSAATNTGKNGFAISTGIKGKAKGALGCYIAVAEWTYDESAGEYKLVGFEAHKVDGKTIKPDTFYSLKNGKFVAVK